MPVKIAKGIGGLNKEIVTSKKKTKKSSMFSKGKNND